MNSQVADALGACKTIGAGLLMKEPPRVRRPKCTAALASFYAIMCLTTRTVVA